MLFAGCPAEEKLAPKPGASFFKKLEKGDDGVFAAASLLALPFVGKSISFGGEFIVDLRIYIKIVKN